jgi:hypothetical protein
MPDFSLSRRSLGALLGGASFAFILYLEPLRLGPLQWSYAWKGVAAVGALLYVGLTYALRPRSGFRRTSALALFALLAFAIWPLHRIAAGDPMGPLLVLSGRRAFVFCVVAMALLWAPRDMNRHRLQRWLATVLVASAFPFVLGLVEPLGAAYDLGGITIQQVRGFVGVFQNAHSASLAYALAAVLCLHEALLGGRRRGHWMVIFAVACTLTVLTFARAGVLALMLGSLVIMRRAGMLRSVGRGVLPAALALVAVATLVTGPELLRRRVLGQTLYNQEVATQVITSGRARMWRATVGAWLSSSPPEVVFGLGDSRVREVVGNATGIDRIPHNGFIYESAAFGLVGLVILTPVLWLFFALYRSLPSERDRVLGQAMLATMVGFGLFQGFEYPVHLVFLALPLVGMDRTRSRMGLPSGVDERLEPARERPPVQWPVRTW